MSVELAGVDADDLEQSLALLLARVGDEGRSTGRRHD
jgi:hypothetical protein